jgi:hypothetical protein
LLPGSHGFVIGIRLYLSSARRPLRKCRAPSRGHLFEEMTMSKPDALAGFSGRKAVLNSVVLLAAVAALSSSAAAVAAAAAPETSAIRAAGVTTDISAARRRHQPRGAAGRQTWPTLRSFGNTMNYGRNPGAGGSFGYGVGDNSRNQTW